MGRFRIVIGALAGVAALAAYLTLVGHSRGNLAGTGPVSEVKVAAPDIAIQAGGRTLRLSSLRGKVVLLDFWATWCGPCRMSIPAVQRLYEKNRARGFEVMGVSMDETAKPLPEFVQAMGMTYPVGLPVPRESAMLYPTSSIPEMLLIDKRGMIRWQQAGFGEGVEDSMDEEIDRLLKEP